MKTERVLLTGGTGYIGSHTAVVLIQAGYEVTLFDSLRNSKGEVVDGIEQITGVRPAFLKGDIRDAALVERVLRKKGIQAVIHLAGLKSVAESIAVPLEYYENNVAGTICLLGAMQASNVRRIIFSSSAAVYGAPKYLPIDESHPLAPTNPYGRAKVVVEELLGDMTRSCPDWNVICLRYFNPAGAHGSGLIGEDPNGTPNNLMPLLARVAAGKMERLAVFGGDYPTRDGSGIRDYIHVMDLAEGHLAALKCTAEPQPVENSMKIINLGTGSGCSVLELIRSLESASGRRIEYQIVPRRPGDVAAVYAKVEKAAEVLAWKASRTIDEMCQSAWKYKQRTSADGLS